MSIEEVNGAVAHEEANDTMAREELQDETILAWCPPCGRRVYWSNRHRVWRTVVGEQVTTCAATVTSTVPNGGPHEPARLKRAMRTVALPQAFWPNG